MIMEPLYLGFDLSTQSVKCFVVNEELGVIYETGLNFDLDLPEYRTSGGVHKDPVNPKIVSAPQEMWTKAIDVIMEKLVLQEVQFEQIVGVSGAAQQHGSVYWKHGGKSILKNRNPENFMFEQLENAFSLSNSPIWMDSSTTEYCRKLENFVGGPKELSRITGSRAYERFTGTQIAKIFHEKREIYEQTERISLVSSFLCSLFLGDYAGIDYSDGSGMNLLDIRTKTWSEKCVQGVTSGDTSGLLHKLGTPVPPESIQGNISKYFVQRYGFRPDCKVVSFTGDNPSSYAGMCLTKNDIAISLGTSDCVYLSLTQLPEIGLNEGHILISPTSSQSEFMVLLCFKNGSLARDRIKRDFAGDSWKTFNSLLESTPRGNFGNMGFYFDLQEILPNVKAGDYRFNKAGTNLQKFSGEEFEIRALVEGQFIAKRVYTERMGYKIGKETRVLATGGGSSNHSILQVISNVFNAPVYVQDTVNSAGLGACYRVKHALAEDGKTFQEVVGDKHGFRKVCDPTPDAPEIYDNMVKRYKILEECIVERI